ncbi:ClbS/DfsB family four-helix bundle protein [Ekhidna sp.]|uniref:ClbS/DfsB family four-helix bundle protein n=1 Tax=Ekhidna sp. TaxID=2608089 RepID=UPI003C798486
MPRPKSKNELLEQSEKNFNKLIEFIGSFSTTEQEEEFAPGTLNRNIRDVLAHLHHWHLLFLDWYNVGMSGSKPEMPAKGYTWKTTSELNHDIREQYKHLKVDLVHDKFKRSHNQLMELINRHTNDELFEKKRYKWTGSTSLGAYLVSSTSSHYDWAFKLIKKGRKKSH